jgi:hypothetical protein
VVVDVTVALAVLALAIAVIVVVAMLVMVEAATVIVLVEVHLDWVITRELGWAMDVVGAVEDDEEVVTIRFAKVVDVGLMVELTMQEQAELILELDSLQRDKKVGKPVVAV